MKIEKLNLKKALELRKAKYTKRWKGRDGKWRYEYKKPSEKKGKKIAIKKEIKTGNIDKIIELNDYEGIRDQDGWETLELTVRNKHRKDIADKILNKLDEKQKKG